jgi:hypothetical protein
MAGSLASHIRKKLDFYLKGKMGLDEFRDWFVANTFDVDRRRTEEDVSVSYDIELLYAEYTNGDWTEEELRRLLEPLVEERSLEEMERNLQERRLEVVSEQAETLAQRVKP